MTERSHYIGPTARTKTRWRDDLHVGVSEAIRKARHEAGMTIVEMAEAISALAGTAIKPNTLQNYEASHVPPPLWVVAAIAEVADVTLDELVP